MARKENAMQTVSRCWYFWCDISLKTARTITVATATQLAKLTPLERDIQVYLIGLLEQSGESRQGD